MSDPIAPIRLLLVEDHADTANALARLLKHAGYDTAVANSADHALKLCEQSRFDLLICDIQLPGHDGNWLMRELSARCGMKGIAVSGLAMPDEIQDGLASGFLDYVTKPVKLDELLARVRAIIERVPAELSSADDSLKPPAL